MVRSEEKFFFEKLFLHFLRNVSIFFFQDLNTAITYSLRFEKEPLLLCDDDALKEQQQQQQHATTTAKESTSEKSGEREDGFEGRERRTFGVVFEDS